MLKKEGFPPGQVVHVFMETFHTGSLIFCFPSNIPPRILTTEVGVIRAMVSKMPFACRKTREGSSGDPHGGTQMPGGADLTLSSPQTWPLTEDQSREAAGVWQKPCLALWVQEGIHRETESQQGRLRTCVGKHTVKGEDRPSPVA